MKILKHFDIYLDRNYEVFSSGDWIEGEVLVELTEELKMSGIHITFRGEAEVDWSEENYSSSSGSDMEDDGPRQKVEKSTAKETYFNSTVVLLGKAPGQTTGHNPILEEGEHHYPFKFQLPEDLPTSYEGDHGHVRYQIKAVIDIPWKFNHITKRTITVTADMDLNDEPQATVAQESHDQKTICCLCCANGPIRAQLKINRTGFVPGEYVMLTGEVDNQSRRPIDKNWIGLYAKTTFHSRTDHKTIWKKVSEIPRDGLEPGETDSFKGLSLHIPPLPPSKLQGCNLIDIAYFLKLIVDPSGPSMDLEIPIEIIIGTIPLKNTKGSFAKNSFALDKYQDEAWIEAVNLEEMEDERPPPLTFEQCVWGHRPMTVKKDREEKNKTKANWAPSYHYFSWGKNLADLDEEDEQQD